MIADPAATATLRQWILEAGGPGRALHMTLLACAHAFDAMRVQATTGDAVSAWQHVAQARYWLGYVAALDLALSRPEVLHKLVSGAKGKAGGAPRGVDYEQVKRHHARLKGDHDATSQTARRFGISTRTVRKILKD